MHRSIQGDDRLAGAGRSGDANRPGVVLLDRLALLGMQEDDPLLPGVVEGRLQLFDRRQDAEPTLCVGMSERIGLRAGDLRRPWLAAHRKLQQRLGGLGGQMVRYGEDRVLRRCSHVREPLRRHAVSEQLFVGDLGEERLLAGRLRLFRRDVRRDHDFLHGLADLDELGGAGLRMRLKFPLRGPVVRLVVMIDVAEQEAVGGFVHDQPNVAIDADRPEVLILRRVELVEAHPRAGRVQLQVESGRLDGLLLVAGESSETARERVGN